MDDIFLRLAAKWEREAIPPKDEVFEDGPIGQVHMQVAMARRETKRECAEKLRLLVGILGEA